MKKITRRIITLFSALVMTISSTYAVFAATGDITKSGEAEGTKVYFYVYGLNASEAEREAFMEDPVMNNSNSAWTKKSETMTGTMIYDAKDLKSYSKPGESGRYLNVSNVYDLFTSTPTQEQIKAITEKTLEGFVYDTTKYEVKWMVIKKLWDGWHVDGIIVPKEVETTTAPPETTTATPETTTAAPETTTVAPETTTAAPETTTVAPETTTVAPETTTVAPETTTAPPETTTATPETTTAGGVSLIEDDDPLFSGETTTAGGVSLIEDEQPLATGDSTNVWVFVAIAVVAAGVIVAVNSKKNEEN